MRSVTLLLALAALSACATQPPPPVPEPTKFIEPPPPPAPRVMTRIVPIPVPTGSAVKDRGRKVNPMAASTSAYYDSLEMPDPSRFAGKDLQYPYDPNLWYQVYTEVGQKTLIRLEAGEKVRNFEEEGGGILWRNTLNYYGGDAGTSRYAVISIKPIRPSQQTQYTIYTNRRKYDLRVTAFREQPKGKALKHVEVSWFYPKQEYNQLREGLQEAAVDYPERRELDDPNDLAHSGGAVDEVLPGCKRGDTYYRVSGTADVDWYPVPTPDGLPRVCDDGRMVRINFPATLGTTEGPSLWEAEDYHGNNVKPLRWRTIGSAYVVDNLPRVMMLRQGAAEVKIVRTRD